MCSGRVRERQRSVGIFFPETESLSCSRLTQRYFCVKLVRIKDRGGRSAGLGLSLWIREDPNMMRTVVEGGLAPISSQQSVHSVLQMLSMILGPDV